MILAAAAPALMQDNLLLGYVNQLAGQLGVDYRPGEESAYLKTLHGVGLDAGDVRVLARILKGRPIKLHEYRAVITDLNRLKDEQLAEDVLRQSVDRAVNAMITVHDQAMREIDERGLTGAFLEHVLLENALFLESGYVAPGGVTDVSCEFRHFIEEVSLSSELGPLVQRYIQTAVAVADAKEIWRKARGGV